MSTLFNSLNYLYSNPDVAQAYTANNYGLSLEDFAQTHYDKYGQNEQRASPTTAPQPLDPSLQNALNYMHLNPDVAQAYSQNNYGLNFQDFAQTHYDKYGQAEQRLWPGTTQQQQPPQTAPKPSSGMTQLPLQDPSKYTANPYLPGMMDAVTQQVTQNLNRNILPNISSAAVSTGGYGGSRQGVVEANALNDVNTGLTNALANMQFGDYNNAMARNLQRYGMDQNYNLGIGALDLGYLNANNNFYTAQRGQDLQQTGLGASIYNMGTQGMLSQGQGLYNLGLTAQQAPWQSLAGFGSTSSPYTGYGSTSQNQSGSAGAGFLGGAIGGAQLFNLWK